MRVSRRSFLVLGAAALAAQPFTGSAGDASTIVMRGDAFGSKVWFDPRGLLVRPGTLINWRNDDRGNSHTTTAFHPANRGRSLRIPAAALPWDSGYLLPGDTFGLTLTVLGVYDYFCIPHEMAGMVGRIIVAGDGTQPLPYGDSDLFPSVEEILNNGVIRDP